ncbi:MAG: hypothetical protein P8144_15170, partial [Gammaproteobacteria bacterium]
SSSTDSPSTSDTKNNFPSATIQTTTHTQTDNPSLTDDVFFDADDQLMDSPHSSSNPSIPSQQKIELTPEEIRQLTPLFGEVSKIQLLVDAIDIDSINKNGGPEILNRNEHEHIMSALEQIAALRKKQEALGSAFSEIIGDPPQDLNEAQQNYFRAFLGGMQHLFIVSNALSSGLFKTKFKIDASSPLEMLGMAAEQTSEAFAAVLPGAGAVVKGAAWLISQLLKNRKINQLSPFSELFSAPTQCSAVAYALADQLARIKGSEIEHENNNKSENTGDSSIRSLSDRCKKIFEKHRSRLARYHLMIEEPGKVDKLAMKDVQKIMERIYAFKRADETVMVDGEPYCYKDIQKAVGSEDGRHRIIGPMLELMGLSAPVQTGNAPQNASQSSNQNQNGENVDIQELIQRISALESEKVDPKELSAVQRMLEQQLNPNFFVAGRGPRAQVHGLAESGAWDRAHPEGALGVAKTVLEQEVLLASIANRVVQLEESIGHSSFSSGYSDVTIAASNAVFKDIRNQISTPQAGSSSVASSGVNTEVEQQETGSILIQAIKRNDGPEHFADLIKDYPEYLNHVITNKQGGKSSALDMAAHYGRPELATLLIKEKAPSAQNKRSLELHEVAKKNKGKYDNQGQPGKRVERLTPILGRKFS